MISCLCFHLSSGTHWSAHALNSVPKWNPSGQHWGGGSGVANMPVTEMVAGCLWVFELRILWWGMLVYKFSLGSFILDWLGLLFTWVLICGFIGNECRAWLCCIVVCVASKQLPVHRNALPMASESTFFQINVSIPLFCILACHTWALFSLHSQNPPPLQPRVTGLCQP